MMCLYNRAAIASVCVVFFILRAAGDKTSFDTVAYDRGCENNLLFKIVYENGTANHAFQLRYMNTLVTATDNCTADTIRVAPQIRGVDIDTEVAFLRRQWSGLKQVASTSPLGKMRLTLSYHFNPYTMEYEFRLSADGVTMVYCCIDGTPSFNGQYRYDRLAQACGYGIAVDVIRKKSRDLRIKWNRCCLQVQVNGTCATTARDRQSLTSRGPELTFVTEADRTPATSGANAIAKKNALATNKTGYIVMTVVLVLVVAVLVVVVWEKRKVFRSRFQRITARC